MNVKLEAACAYGRMGWRIFPCHSVIRRSDGYLVCSCERDCKSPGKHPRTKRGLLEATDDEATIRRWWGRWPDANIALATGSGLAVFDIDGAAGEQEFRQLVAQHGPVPATLAARTGRGVHLVYATRSGAGEVKSSARGNVHVRGEGGYIIVEPSDHISGRKYQWVKKVAVAPLPDWLRQWSQGYDVARNNAGLVVADGFGNLGPVPAYLRRAGQTNQRDISRTASDALRTEWTPSEQARLISALTAIPVKACGYDEFLKIGFALHSLDWQRSDGTSIAFDIWNDWCAQSEHHNHAGLEAKWKSFDRSARGEVSVASIYHMARLAGWNGGAPAIAGSPEPSSPAAPPGEPLNGTYLNGHANGAQVLPVAFGGLQPIIFPDVNDKNLPRATMTNAKVAVGALGLDCRYDLFHNRMLVAGQLISKWNSSELSDHVAVMIRDMIRYRFGFDPNKTNVQDACEALCLARRFDPVLDYLDGLQWDGRPRLDSWLTTTFGAAPSEYIAAVARLSLMAAVRRARQPGAKFDEIIVLEGLQGQGKSEALEILAGPDNFSDQSILGADDRKQQELTEGVWLYEIGELSGMRRAEVDHVKAFASRKRDRARPAYGRYPVSQARRTVFFASTNRSDYLQDDTGNRRFWPVACTVPRGGINLDRLHRDRDQLWAEAAANEARGDSIRLARHLWSVAGEEQERRREVDAWHDPIAQYLDVKNPAFVSVMEVLVDNQFMHLRAGEVGQREQNRAAGVLRGLGWIRVQKRMPDGTTKWRYRKADGGDPSTS